MISVSIDSIQRDLKKYIRRVQRGESITVLLEGRPVAEINPPTTQESCRPFGLCAGEFMVPDDFDEPLPDDIINQFEGK